jgi:hypothetical protein
MTSPGVCSCGEPLPPSSGPSHVCKRPMLLDMGDWQHPMYQAIATPQTRPYRCPVCEGRGHVPAGFYTGGWGAGTSPETCQSCQSSGVLWA